ncbi:hypothetical protein MHU86_4470 [Fragilaria crotonensis]|nr:hypothetical protein MHU86_4470 [Fragilaria crotonensis]
MYEDTWSPCASARGSNYSLQPSVHPEEVSRVLTSLVPTSKPKLLAPLCETAIGIRLSLPEYAKFFGSPMLLNKGIYGLVYSGKYWNIEFSNGSTPKVYQSPSEPSYFVRYDKHNQWLRLLFFVDDMLYAGSNDSIEKQFEDSVRNRFDVKFLGPAQWFLQMRIHKHSDSSYTSTSTAMF